ncbi:MAG TPA: putative sulfate exporter family transporter [Sphingomicrobium sp.]|nr:putative sulfate exporter family transporter [Sphingomicrobium sp.]
MESLQTESVPAPNRPAAPGTLHRRIKKSFEALTHGFIIFAPGLLLAAAIAAAALALRAIPGLELVSPIALALVVGAAFRLVSGTQIQTQAGLRLASRRLLRLAVVMLGFQITIAQMIHIGLSGIAVVGSSVIATFAFTVGVGRLLKIDRSLSQLLAAGTSICGASAILAANSVISAKDEDVAYAIGCITLFGTLAIFSYPLLAAAAGLDSREYGLWAGASIHEIAQVVAAAFQLGQEAGQYGTISKLVRVAFLAPMIGVMSGFAWTSLSSQATVSRPPFPLFIIGFLAVVVVNSLVTIPDFVRMWLSTATGALFALSLAALGLELELRQVANRGWAPLALAAMATLFVALFSFVAIKILL